MVHTAANMHIISWQMIKQIATSNKKTRTGKLSGARMGNWKKLG